MEPESGERELQPAGLPTLCANACGFFGSAATNNLCSKCFRDAFLTKPSAALSAAAPPPERPAAAEAGGSTGEAPKKPSNRCGICHKKVGLMGFKCRCGDTFCSAHRYSDKHGCAFDYRGAGQDAIARANPVVKADKVEKI